MKSNLVKVLAAAAFSLALATPGYSSAPPEKRGENQAAAKNLPHVVILATGGTIASTSQSTTDNSNYRVTNGVEALISAVPEVRDIARVTGEQVVNVMSPSFSDEDRLTLGKRINETLAREDVAGVVVTHGTATLEQTAYFLNLVVKSDKPVVVVGAMRPASAISADGPANLYNAVKVAADLQSRGKGVLIVLNDRIGAARFTSKTSAWSTETFKSLEQGFLGDIVAGKVRFYQQPVIKHTYQADFDISRLTALPKVEILHLSYGNTDTSLLRATIASGAQGLITVGSGTSEFTKKLVALAAKGLGGAEQKKVEHLAMLVKEGGAGAERAQDELKRMGDTRSVVIVNSFWQATGQALYSYDHIVDSNSLPPLKARILLQLALTKTTDPKEIQKYFDQY